MRERQRAWTLADDLKLHVLVTRLGLGNWAGVADEMERYTTSECRRRYLSCNARKKNAILRRLSMVEPPTRHDGTDFVRDDAVIAELRCGDNLLKSRLLQVYGETNNDDPKKSLIQVKRNTLGLGAFADGLGDAAASRKKLSRLHTFLWLAQSSQHKLKKPNYGADRV